jgi:hypothetical protein
VGRGATESLELTMERDPHAVVGRGAAGLGGPLPPREEYRTRPISIGAVVVSAGGALLLGSAGVFYALRQGAISSCAINAQGLFECATREQANALVANAGQAETMNALTNVALIGGTIVLAGGVSWLIADRVTSRERIPTQARRPAVGVIATHQGASVSVGGAW